MVLIIVGVLVIGIIGFIILLLIGFCWLLLLVLNMVVLLKMGFFRLKDFDLVKEEYFVFVKYRRKIVKNIICKKKKRFLSIGYRLGKWVIWFGFGSG